MRFSSWSIVLYDMMLQLACVPYLAGREFEGSVICLPPFPLLENLSVLLPLFAIPYVHTMNVYITVVLFAVVCLVLLLHTLGFVAVSAIRSAYRRTYHNTQPGGTLAKSDKVRVVVRYRQP